jgi:hypothetical protein
MAIDDNQTDDIASLIESGRFNDETDVTDLVAALNGTSPSVPKSGGEEAPKDGEVAPPDEGKLADTDPAATSADPPATPAAASEPDGDDGDSTSFRTHPLYGVLKGTRHTLAKTKEQAKTREQELLQERDVLRRQNDELLAKVNTSQASQHQVQQAADDAGLVDQDGNPIDVGTIDIEKLREDYDGPLVEAIASLQQLVGQQTKVISDMRKRETTRDRTDEERIADEVQQDIDSIPALAALQAKGLAAETPEDRAKWRAALVTDEEVSKDPAWKNRSRQDRFQEVARILGLGTQVPEPKPGSSPNADLAVRKAVQQAAGKAVPTSLSDMPSGTPAGQSEQETLEGLSTDQIAAKMANMTSAQQDALLLRLGG